MPNAAPRIWRVGPIVYDEAEGFLRTAGERRNLETKPLALFRTLLTRSGEVVLKRDLIAAVWGNADHTAEASLATAMSKLRRALGAEGRNLIELVHGIGYRLTGPIEMTPAETQVERWDFRPDAPVPMRPVLRLLHELDPAPEEPVWAAIDPGTGARHVFTFTRAEARRAILHRRVVQAQALQAALGTRPDLVRVLDWSTRKSPWFIDCEDGGCNLADWAIAGNGLAAIPLATRLAVLARVARILADCHAIGITHGNLRPTTIFVNGTSPATLSVRLGGFGGATLRGSESWTAPERAAGGEASVAADLYALAVLLFQMFAGDLASPLAVGFETLVPDPLIRADIAEAAQGDPERRLASAAIFAERIETLALRRQHRDRLHAEAALTATLTRMLERNRARRPWMIAAIAALTLGLVSSSVLAITAVRARDAARHQARLTRTINSFLTDDVLGRTDPALAARPDETLMQAVVGADARIDTRFATSPMTAGQIHLAMADALTARAAYPQAATSYAEAIAAFDRAGRSGTAETAIAQLREAIMQAVSVAPGSIARADALVAIARQRMTLLRARRPEIAVWLMEATGLIELVSGDPHFAVTRLARAADLAQTMPAAFDARTQLAMRRRQAFAALRVSDTATADRLMIALLPKQVRIAGVDDPGTLQLKLTLAQLALAEGHPQQTLSQIDAIMPDFAGVFGPTHRATIGLLAVRAEAEQQLGLNDAAFADQMTAWHAARTKEGPQSFVALASLAGAAESGCRAGQATTALPLAQDAYRAAQHAFSADNVLVSAAAFSLAFCDVIDGAWQSALTLLDQIDTKRLTDMSLAPDTPAAMLLLRGVSLAHTGHPDQGRSYLIAARHALSGPDADPYLRNWINTALHQLPGQR